MTHTSLFGITEDNIENYQSIDERFIKNKTSTFFFEADTDAMEPTIFRGEILLVDRSIEDVHNRICIVSLSGDLMCRRVAKTNQGIILISDNSKYKDVLISEVDEIEIWGVVTSHHGEL